MLIQPTVYFRNIRISPSASSVPKGHKDERQQISHRSHAKAWERCGVVDTSYSYTGKNDDATRFAYLFELSQQHVSMRFTPTKKVICDEN